MLNINNSDDISYRYQMPQVSIKYAGNGNGKYTIINNMDEIAIALNSPSEIIYKFISFSCGSAYNEKDKSITGHHDNIQSIIFDYINNFVICETCNIPELNYYLEKISAKKTNLICKCSACGTINKVKYNNKLNIKCVDAINKYLIKNNNWIDTCGTMVQQDVII
jgi:translation initiation factor 2 beta subunit (eIF-2beta)/eIF-5